MPGAAVVRRSAYALSPGVPAAANPAVKPRSNARFARGFRGQRREQLAEALADFSPDERVALVRLLTKLADAWPQA